MIDTYFNTDTDWVGGGRVEKNFVSRKHSLRKMFSEMQLNSNLIFTALTLKLYNIVFFLELSL
jgi:hypothetical protein